MKPMFVWLAVDLGCRAVGVVADGTVAAQFVYRIDNSVSRFTCIVISRRYHFLTVGWHVWRMARAIGGKFEGRVKSKSIK